MVTCVSKGILEKMRTLESGDQEMRTDEVPLMKEEVFTVRLYAYLCERDSSHSSPFRP